RCSSHVMLVCSVHGGGIDLYQYSTYFVRSRFLYFLDLENVWRSETFADDSFHEFRGSLLRFDFKNWTSHISRVPPLSWSASRLGRWGFLPSRPSPASSLSQREVRAGRWLVLSIRFCWSCLQS